MQTSLDNRSFVAVALAALAFTACDSTQNAPTVSGIAPDQVSAVVLPSSGVVSAGGDFTAATPNNSGRVTTEFWDNFSADDNTIKACNLGFYAAGTLATDCRNKAAGSDAGQGSLVDPYNTYLNINRAPAPFTFDGGKTYTVSLVGSYAGSISKVGYFTKDAGGYVFTEVPNWSNKTIGTTVAINTAGKPWGFFISNSLFNATLACGINTACSDATGGFAAAPNQQFALFATTSQKALLAGAEDNLLNPLLGDLDSDYNDYIWKVVPDVSGGQGCSPGYWKTHSAWPAPYAPNQTFSSAFGGSTAFGTKTLQQVISQGGGGLNALGRQAVGALMNAASPGVSYELTPAQVVAKFNAATPATYESVKDEFEALTDVNGRICPNPAPN
jgi:hypothetical protein